MQKHWSPSNPLLPSTAHAAVDQVEVQGHLQFVVERGFGLGAGMAQGIGRVMIEKGMPPFVMYPQILWATFALVLGISFVSALIGIIKVSRVDAASVFRG